MSAIVNNTFKYLQGDRMIWFVVMILFPDFDAGSLQ